MQHIPTFAAGLARHGDAPALVTGDSMLSYRELADHAADLAHDLGPGRRLVGVTLTNDIPSITAYLAALAAGHVVLVMTPDRNADVLRRFTPDTVVTDGHAEIRHETPRHELHPELAVLLSTSGSTGSPRMIRLSHENLHSNAAAIAEYQQLSATDCSITSLPLHYCYGMSVLHSHLHVGGRLVVTDLSVVDRCFWALADRFAVTTFAGVPHTYDLIDSASARERMPDSLRLLTQAGGALPADRVRELAGWAMGSGREFMVMYGQAEATARISYLPPQLARDHPDCVGVAIPGGAITIARPDADGVGELVYEGPNVMLGYAECPGDLARGRDIAQLRTGDRAMTTAGGLVSVLGRDSRRAKLFGLRLDLDRVDSALQDAGSSAHCATDDHQLIVAARQDDPVTDEALIRAVVGSTGLPPSSVAVFRVADIPRTSSGKPDFTSIAQCGVLTPERIDERATPTVREAFARTLRIDPARIYTGDSFVSLGGDSLSYVLAAQRLGRVVDPLPRNWHLLTVGELERSSRGRRGWQQVEATVAVRALAVLAVVASHIGVIDVRGGAFILMALAGMSFARFPLAKSDRRERLTHALRSWRRIVVPSVMWLVAVALFAEEYQWPVILATNLFGPPGGAPEWRYWFVESLVYILAAVIALLCVPAVHRLETRDPWVFAMGVVGVGLVLRYTMLPGAGPQLASPATMLWFFAVGWALVAARTKWRVAITFTALAAGLPGFFAAPSRGLIVAVALLLVVTVPTLRLPRSLAAALSSVAGASLFLYLTHWQVFPPLQQWPWLALVASVAAGLTAHAVYEWAAGRLTHAWLTRLPAGAGPGPTAPLADRRTAAGLLA